MSEQRPTNSERHLRRLEEQEHEEREKRGILELFDDPSGGADEPLERDQDRQPRR